MPCWPACWRKDRIDGTVWDPNCELAEGYAELTSAANLKRLSRLGIMVTGMSTPH